MLIDRYFDYQIKYENIYGHNTVVLMEVGSFYELYGVNNNKEKIGDIKKITDLLNIILTRRNKAIIENSRKNSLMAGFPSVSLKRYLNILINSGYTTVLVEQVSPPPNPKREVTQIISNGTQIDYLNQADSNYLCSIYINEDSCLKTGLPVFSAGISIIDISTGKSVINEFYTKKNDNKAFIEELIQYTESYSPSEVILNLNNVTNINKKDIVLNIPNRTYHFYENKIDRTLFKISYQKTFFEKIYKNIYKNNGGISIFEFLNIEKRELSRISLILLLDFAYKHNETVIEKLDKPTVWNSGEHLILHNSAIYQLNVNSINGIFNNNVKYNSLFEVINKTSTPMGKRLLKDYLLHPICNADVLKNRYNIIHSIIETDKSELIKDQLSLIPDIERLHRRLSLTILHPSEFVNLNYAYQVISDLNENINDCELNGLNINTNVLNNFNKLIAYYNSVFNVDDMIKYNLNDISDSFFIKGKYEDIDILQEEINSCNNYFNETAQKLSIIIDKYSKSFKKKNSSKKINNYYNVKIDFTERDGYFLTMTKARYKILNDNYLKKNKTDFQIKNRSTNAVKLISSKLTNTSHKLISLCEKMKWTAKKFYIEELKYIYKKYAHTLVEINSYISKLDFYNSGAIVANTFHYSKPLIENLNDNTSFLNVTGFRHPIIERIQFETNYVKNDIKMGCCFANMDNEGNDGILLFGLNGVGKSSFMKAIGLNVIMAQIGYYVAADSFKFYPFNNIFTRISGNDDIFKGKSSFIVEMTELRSILKYSDKNSLVLGDEVCKGTEDISALSIITSAVQRFSNKNVKFIFATHMHKLSLMNEVTDIKNINLCHLDVKCNNNKIIYSRKLRDGPGKSIYGLEVAKYVLDDSEFINNAFEIRHSIMNKEMDMNNDIIPKKSSIYNSDLFIDKCSICNSTENLDVHHILFQCAADKNKNIGHIYKNSINNLVVLCKRHHQDVHSGCLTIDGYNMTSKGKELIYKFNNKKKRKKKYTNMVDLIMNYNNYTTKIAKFKLNKEHNIKISEKTIKKIWSNNY